MLAFGACITDIKALFSCRCMNSSYLLMAPPAVNVSSSCYGSGDLISLLYEYLCWKSQPLGTLRYLRERRKIYSK